MVLYKTGYQYIIYILVYYKLKTHDRPANIMTTSTTVLLLY